MRRDTWIPVAVLLLSAAFTLVSLLLAVTAGRSRPLLRAKLRLGGALLTLGGVAVGSTACTTCYKDTSADSGATPACEASSRFPAEVSVPVVLQVDLVGSACSPEAWSWALRDRSSELVTHRGALTPRDGAHDEHREVMSVALPADVSPGSYRLEIYEGSAADEGGGEPISEPMDLEVVEAGGGR